MDITVGQATEYLLVVHQLAEVTVHEELRVGFATVVGLHVAGAPCQVGVGECGVKVPRQVLVAVVGVESPTEGKLLAVAQTDGGLSAGFRLAEGGQEHAGENADDGDDHEQLDERETSTENVIPTHATHAKRAI